MRNPWSHLTTVLLAVILQAGAARGEVRATGTSAAMTVDARDASLEEVLTALGMRFGLRHRSTIALDRPITGSYQGDLPRVVRRLLDGYDFVFKTGAAHLEVVVIGAAAPDQSQSARTTAATSTPQGRLRRLLE